MSTQPLDAWQRRRLRETKGLVVRKQRGLEKWDVIDETSGRTVHTGLSAAELRVTLSGDKPYLDVLGGEMTPEKLLVISLVKDVARYRAAALDAEDRLNEMVEQFGYPDDDTLAKLVEIAEMEELLKAVTS